MKNTIKHYLMIVIGIILLTCCENIIGEKEIDWNKESNLFSISPEGKLFYKSELYSGIVKNIKEEKGKFEFEGIFRISEYSFSSWKEGIPHGYWEGGKDKREIKNYKDGILDGNYEYQSQYSFEKFIYENGKKSGEMVFNRFDDGKVKRKYENGNLNGIQEDYYPSGELGCRVNYSNGIIVGDLEVFYKNGNIMIRKSFKDGDLTGEIFYKKNGSTTSKYDLTSGEGSDLDFSEVMFNERYRDNKGVD